MIILKQLVDKVMIYWSRYPLLVDLGIIALSLVFFFSPVFFSGKVISNADFIFNWSPWNSVAPEGYTGPTNPVLSDSVDSTIPMMKDVEDRTLREILNGYSEHSWGRPNPSVIGTGASHEPFFILFIKLLGIPYGSTAYFIFKTFVAGVGMYLLTGALRLNRSVRIFSAISYMYSIPLIAALMEFYTGIYSLLPILFLMAFRLSNRPTHKDRLIFIAIGSLVVLLGFPTLILYAFLFTGVFYILLQLRQNGKNYRTTVVNTIKYFLLNISILFLLAFSLVPNYASYERLDLSYREDYGMRQLNSQHFGQILNPWICGNQSTEVPDHCGSNWLETSTYSGIIPFMALALTLAVMNDRTRYKYFFVLLTAIQLILIFNIFDVNSVIGKLPILSQNPNTRLVVFIPFSVVLFGAFSLQDLMSPQKMWKRRSLISIFIILLLFLIVRLRYPGLLVSFFDFIQVIQPTVFMDLVGIYLLISILFLLFLLGQVYFKNLKTKLSILTLLILAVVPLLELSYFSSIYPPYIDSSQYMPETKGIKYLKSNSVDGDRILTLERSFLPNISHYYGIENLIGHDFRTEEFSENVNRIDSSVFVNTNTLDFLNRSTVELSSESHDYLEFNRVKYLIQDPAGLDPRYDQIALQPNSNMLISQESTRYIYQFDKDDTLTNIRIWVECYNLSSCSEDSGSVRSIDLSVKLATEQTPAISQGYEIIAFKDNYIELQLTPIHLKLGDQLQIDLNKNDNFGFQAYLGRDFIPNGMFEDPMLDGDLKMQIYDYDGSDQFPTVYSDDILVSEVYEGEGSAYYYKCGELNRESCLDFLKNFQIDDDFSNFNALFEELIPLDIIEYSPGQIKIETKIIAEEGVILLADNYYKGWSADNGGQVLQGFVGAMNVYIDDELQAPELTLKYVNPYLKPGITISIITVIILTLPLIVTTLKKKTKRAQGS